MERILLKRIATDLRSAAVGVETGDKWMLELAAFHVQQAFEKILKQVYLEYGTNYPESSNIAVLISSLPSSQCLLSSEEVAGLREIADILTSWEIAVHENNDDIEHSDLVAEYLQQAEVLFQKFQDAIRIKDAKVCMRSDM